MLIIAAVLGVGLLCVGVLALTGKTALTLEKAGTTGATLILQNGTLRSLTYGEDYSLERLQEGEWVAVEPVRDDYAFASVGYSLPARGRRTLEIDWEWLYGRLAPGDYRIGKEVSVGDGKQMVTASFRLPDETEDAEN